MFGASATDPEPRAKGQGPRVSFKQCWHKSTPTRASSPKIEASTALSETLTDSRNSSSSESVRRPQRSHRICLTKNSGRTSKSCIRAPKWCGAQPSLCRPGLRGRLVHVDACSILLAHMTRAKTLPTESKVQPFRTSSHLKHEAVQLLHFFLWRVRPVIVQECSTCATV